MSLVERQDVFRPDERSIFVSSITRKSPKGIVENRSARTLCYFFLQEVVALVTNWATVHRESIKAVIAGRVVKQLVGVNAGIVSTPDQLGESIDVGVLRLEATSLGDCDNLIVIA